MFYRAQTDATWTTLSDWGPNSTAQINTNTPGFRSGNYAFAIYARAAGNTSTDGTNGFTYNIGNVCTAAAIALPNKTSIGANETVQFTASATCNGAVPEYDFRYRKQNGPSWLAWREFSESPTASWNATGREPGKYEFLVYARGKNNPSALEATAPRVTLPVGLTCSAATLSATPTSPRDVGTQVTLNATASCGGAAVQYRFYYRDFTQQWLPINPADEWSNASSTVWNTTGLNAAKYELLVNTRVQGNSSDSEAPAQTVYHLGAVCTSVTADVTPATPQAIGTNLTVTGTATCRSGAVPEYWFTYRGPDGIQRDLQPWSTSNSAAFDTEALQAGGYNFYVYTRGTTNPGWDSVVGRAFTLASPCGSPSSGADGGAPRPDSDGDGTPDACDPCDNRTDSDGDGIPNCVEQFDATLWTDPNLFNGAHATRGTACNLQCSSGLTQASISQCLSQSAPTQAQNLSSGWSWNQAYSGTSCATNFGFFPNWSSCPAPWYIDNNADLRAEHPGWHCFKVAATAAECGGLFFDGNPVSLAPQAECFEKATGMFPIRWFVQPAADAQTSFSINYCFGGSAQCNPTQPLPRELLRPKRPPGTSCLSNADCSTGLECGTNNGMRFGRPATDDVCWPPSCAHSPEIVGCGAAGAPCGRLCSDHPPCTSNSDCPSGQVCGVGNGPRFGEAAANVCWPASCASGGASSHCGPVSAPCGTCQCLPNCSGKSCGDDSSDGCGGECRGLCSNRQSGCTSNLQCAAGLYCDIGGGPKIGLPANTNVCLPTACAAANILSPLCGSTASQCGTCPTCTRQCGTAALHVQRFR
jgi:hypothetical protein